MKSYTPLRISAEDSTDLEVLACCLQDALIPISGIEFDEEEGNFNLILNRFCWECDPEDCEGTPYYSRVPAGLAIHHVKNVQRRDINRSNPHELVNLLTLIHDEDGTLRLIFSGGSEIKLTVDKVSCHLKDVDEPYPTLHKPCHAE